MEIHLKIKRSKKELEALENQEKEVSEMNWVGKYAAECIMLSVDF